MFFLINPIRPNLTSSKIEHRFERHHIICRYVSNIYGPLPNMEEQYNKIEVPYSIHVILHLVRYIEFLYPDDLIACSAIKKKEDLKSASNNEYGITTVLKQCISQALYYVSAPKAQRFCKRTRDYHIRILDPNIEKIFNKKMVWDHIDYEGIGPVIIEVDEVNLVSDVSNKLMSILLEHLKKNPDMEKKHTFYNENYNFSRTFRDYLAKKKYRTKPPYGWKLRNF